MKIGSNHGGVLLAVTVFVGILAIAAASVMQLSLSSNKLSQRNELRARARAVAESELELLYYSFSKKVTEGKQLPDIANQLATDGLSDSADIPTTLRDPFLQLHRSDNAGGGWRIYRSFKYDDSIGVVFGIIPNSKKTGSFAYYNAKIIVRPPANSALASNDKDGNDIYQDHPADDPMAVRIGRHMMTSTTSIFQYNVFYQNDLEFTPGGQTVLDGDIASNGNAYLAAVSGASLTIGGQVRYLLHSYFNKDIGNLATDFTHTLRKPGTYNPGNTLVDPTFTGFDATTGDYATSPLNTQVETMTEKENLLGGADANVIAKTNPSLFGPTDTPANLADAINNVYRSVLAPPPSVAAPSEYPGGTVLSSVADDPSISALRLYNRAKDSSGLIVTVNSSGAVESITQDGVVKSSGALWDAVTAGGVVTNKGAVHDWREGKDVATTEVDVGKLKTALEANYTDFSGIFYVNLKNATADVPAAVRLVNAETTPHPNFDPTSSSSAHNDPKASSGFSVCTNGGLYVKGNYNTTALTDSSGTAYVNPAMLMGDAVTVLSQDWNDSNSTQPLDTSRIATASDITFKGESLSRTMVVAAGILTGFVPASTSHPSGGAQNLVRYLEAWQAPDGTNAYNVKFYGSMGSLFNSRYFVAPIDSNGGVGSVYRQPKVRTFSFNSTLKLRPPQGTPTITRFSRGNFFLWTK